MTAPSRARFTPPLGVLSLQMKFLVAVATFMLLGVVAAGGQKPDPFASVSGR